MNYGNKGAVSFKFKIGITTICFINMHLAAGGKSVKNERLENIQNIFGKMFNGKLLNTTDYIFMGGDMNFRCNDCDNVQMIDKLNGNISNKDLYDIFVT